MLYTNRRANVEAWGFSWVHGTEIGIASSNNGGHTWFYRGIAEGLAYERERNTYRAPEILWPDGRYHMYVSCVPGVPQHWTGPRHILHHTSHDLWSWEFCSRLESSSSKVIDACIFRIPAGHWRMWFEDEAHASHTYAATAPTSTPGASPVPSAPTAHTRDRTSLPGTATTGC